MTRALENVPLEVGDLKLDYYPYGIFAPDRVFEDLKTLEWIRVNNTPRSEYFASDVGLPYTYGRGAGIRTYQPQPWTQTLKFLQKVSEDMFAKCRQEVLFLNRYDDQKDQLGWHADDSPEMDDARPITIISLGAERDIMFRSNTEPEKSYKFRLKHGSVLLMPPGFQDTHMHRIPKSDNGSIGTRISLTFRGYVHEST